MEEKERKFTKFFNENFRNVESYMRFRTFNNQYHKDLTSQVFMKIYINWDHLDETRNIPAYLQKSVNNVLIDFFRKKGRTPNFTEINDYKVNFGQNNHHHQIDSEELLLRIDKVLNEKERNIFHLRLDGWKIKEVAENSLLTISDVKTSEFRIRKKLQIILQKVNY
jgi:RNA polymerase sigma-70 factor (ECF subfamily)